MAQYNKFAESMNGLFKNVYGDEGPKELIPDGVKLYKMISFNGKDKAPGNLFIMSVILG